LISENKIDFLAGLWVHVLTTTLAQANSGLANCKRSLPHFAKLRHKDEKQKSGCIVHDSESSVEAASWANSLYFAVVFIRRN